MPSTLADKAVMVAGLQCPLCGGKGRVWGYSADTELRACCGCLLAWPWSSPEEYEALYREGLRYHHDECLRIGMAPQYERLEEHSKAAEARLNWLTQKIMMTNILDVGSSNGAFVHTARNRGYLAWGLEPNPTMCQRATQSLEIPVVCGDWRAVAGYWDLVVATDVIEHFTDPLGFLNRCRDHADWLYLETPDFRANRPQNWKHIKPREHPCLYSEEALASLVIRAGWKCTHVLRPIEGKLAMALSR